MEFNQKLFGKVLREVRKTKMKRADFSEAIQMVDESVGRIESGSRLTTIPNLVKMCEVLEVTPNELLGACVQVNNLEGDPAIINQLISLLCQFNANEMEMALEILQSIQKHIK